MKQTNKMKILISIPYGTKLLVQNTTNAGALLSALTEVSLIKEDGYGDKKTFTFAPSNEQPEVEIKPDDFMKTIASDDPIATLRQEKATSDARWVEYYQKANALETQLKALKQDLDERGITYKKDEVAK